MIASTIWVADDNDDVKVAAVRFRSGSGTSWLNLNSDHREAWSNSEKNEKKSFCQPPNKLLPLPSGLVEAPRRSVF